MVRQLAIRQRKRLVATVMGTAERSPWWAKLRREEQDAFRTGVLGAIDTYHDFMLDVIGVARDDSIRSEQALELLERIYNRVKAG